MASILASGIRMIIPGKEAKDADLEASTEGSPIIISVSAHPSAEESSTAEEKKEEAEKEPECDPGTHTSTKELYRKERYHDWEAWEGEIPEDDAEKYKKHALVARRERDPEGGGVLLHSINIQSPYIRKFLSKVFEGYRGVYTDLKRLTFRPPYFEFYYRWDKFNEELAAIDDDTTREHVALLQKVIEPEIKPHLEAREDHIKLGVVTFDYVWALFPPDTEVYAKTDSGERLYIARRGGYKKTDNGTYYVVDCEYIDYNGVVLGHGTERLEINFFRGHLPITEINPLPTSFVPDIDDIRKRLTDRGRAFEKLIGVHYKGYSGNYRPTQGNSFMPKRRQYLDKGRVVIDAKLFYEQDPDRRPFLRGLGSDIKETEKGDDDYEYYEQAAKDEGWISTEDKENVRPGRTTLNDDEYCLCTPLVTGYCLTSKQWATFEALNVTEVVWSHRAFDNLVLPYDHKELILAFAQSQLEHKGEFDDIVAGKGQGIVMLLTGEPGVGKTLTAEAVSEEMRCPLYSMSAGELGSDAYDLEVNLQKVLEISAKWDAVLLLDEADVFLEQRSSTDIHRNKLVSVFLRLLEYYKGVMFLTTNRSNSFDPAFQSRIHLTIDYPSLDSASRRSIWQTFVRPDGVEQKHKSTLSARDLSELSEMTLNGREIKNIVKTAKLLAARKDVGLGIDHIKTVLRINPRYVTQEHNSTVQG